MREARNHSAFFAARLQRCERAALTIEGFDVIFLTMIVAGFIPPVPPWVFMFLLTLLVACDRHRRAQARDHTVKLIEVGKRNDELALVARVCLDAHRSGQSV